MRMICKVESHIKTEKDFKDYKNNEKSFSDNEHSKKSEQQFRKNKC